MRSALVTLFCALSLVIPGGTGTRADNKADVDKEFKKFQDDLKKCFDLVGVVYRTIASN